MRNILRRNWLLVGLGALILAALIPIVPTGWLTRVDTSLDASSAIPAQKVAPSAPKAKGPRPFVVDERVRLTEWMTGFGIPSKATGAINTTMTDSDGCKDGHYGVRFDNFPPSKGFTGYCVPAWKLESID